MSAPGIRRYTDVDSDGTAEVTLWTIDASQITPGSNGQVLTTTAGAAGWAAAAGGGGSGTATALSGTGIVNSTHILDGTILNADVNASAAIAYSKLALTGSIVSGDITDGTIAGGDLSSTIAIPSAATATTQSAADNSTKLSTTAYVDTAGALKANLASPTFTGSPVLPTGTTGSTQTANDRSTKLATTAYADASADRMQAAIGPGFMAPFDPRLIAGVSVFATFGQVFSRVVAPKSGTLTTMAMFVGTSSGSVAIGVYDCGEASAGTYTQLLTSGSTACGTAANWQVFSGLSLAVVGGRSYNFALSMDNATATFGRVTGNAAAQNKLPTGFLPVTGGAQPKLSSGQTMANYATPMPTAIAEATMAEKGLTFCIIGLVT